MALCLAGASAHADDPLVVAHRGASRAAPENTLPAFNLAWKHGADAIEGDFRLTLDGVAVCIHDTDTKRVAETNLVVKDSTLAELRTLDVGAWHGKDYKGALVPSAADVFATVPKGKKVYVEVKCGPEIVPVLLKDVEKAKLSVDQVVFISFDAEVIAAFKSAAPELTALWVLKFKKDVMGKIKPSVASVLATLDRINADGCSTKFVNLRESSIRHIEEKGYQFHVWTVDDMKTADRMKNWGVLSITTNVPGRMVEHFAK